jgi:hypothetical protein
MELGDSGVSTTLLHWHCCLLILILHFVILSIFYIWIAFVSLLDKLNAYYQMAHAMHNMTAHFGWRSLFIMSCLDLGKQEREGNLSNLFSRGGYYEVCFVFNFTFLILSWDLKWDY